MLPPRVLPLMSCVVLWVFDVCAGIMGEVWLFLKFLVSMLYTCFSMHDTCESSTRVQYVHLVLYLHMPDRFFPEVHIEFMYLFNNCIMLVLKCNAVTICSLSLSGRQLQ